MTFHVRSVGTAYWLCRQAVSRSNGAPPLRGLSAGPAPCVLGLHCALEEVERHLGPEPSRRGAWSRICRGTPLPLTTPTPPPSDPLLVCCQRVNRCEPPRTGQQEQSGDRPPKRLVAPGLAGPRHFPDGSCCTTAYPATTPTTPKKDHRCHCLVHFKIVT